MSTIKFVPKKRNNLDIVLNNKNMCVNVLKNTLLSKFKFRGIFFPILLLEKCLISFPLLHQKYHFPPSNPLENCNSKVSGKPSHFHFED